MSQNDFTIANQSFPAFRADLNSALQALASNNSGGSAPSTTFANMWWYDSSNNIMYIRNEDNDAWIKFAELDQANDKFVLSGTLQLDDGTVSAPALTFNSDTNMGIYRGGTDILKFVTAGTDAVTINASQQVGIGTSSPVGQLELERQSNANYSGSFTFQGGSFHITDTSNSTTYPTASAQLHFTVGSTGLAESYIAGLRESANKGALAFGTQTSATRAERMRIDSNGNVGIGTSSPFQFSSVQADITLSGTSPSFSTRAGALTFQSQDTTSTLCHIHARDGYMAFETGTSATTTERMRILSTGGITFNGDTSSANALDDYEEGSLSLSVATGTASFAYARYTKVGNLVTIRFNISAISDQSSTSNLLVTGLPFTSTADNQSASGILSRYFNGGGDAYIAYISASQSQVQFFQTVNNGNYHQVRHVDLTNANANAFVTISYETT